MKTPALLLFIKLPLVLTLLAHGAGRLTAAPGDEHWDRQFAWAGVTIRFHRQQRLQPATPSLSFTWTLEVTEYFDKKPLAPVKTSEQVVAGRFARSTCSRGAPGSRPGG